MMYYVFSRFLCRLLCLCAHACIMPKQHHHHHRHRAHGGKKTSAQQRKIRMVMHEWRAGHLHSGSKNGPRVVSQKQAEAIAISEANRASRRRRNNSKKH